jgi:predicted nucleic-acid-binding Zn-ribbon protein
MEQKNENIKLVTVATFPEAIEAHIYRSRLEAEGIPSVVADENIITNQPWHSIAYGGVKLRVRDQDQEKALAVINTIRYGAEQANESPAVAPPPECPVCGAGNIKQKKISGTWALILSVLFLYPLRYHYKLTCLTCGYRWRS